MTDIREVIESPLTQGKDEAISYNLTTTPWGSSPSSVVVKVFDITDGAYTDVTSTVLSGSASITGDIITLPSLQALTAGHVYRIEIGFISGGNTFEPYCIFYCEV